MILTFDFHNHSCLSPCASLENAPSAMAARVGLIPLFGLEINPFEEAHLLAIFPDPLLALAFSDWVVQYLPQIEVAPSQFGDQVVVDPEDEILAMPSAWYGNSLQQLFTFFAKEAAGVGALVIPAHVDRPQFSVYSQLGFLPEGEYDAMEAMVRSPIKNFAGGTV